MTARIDLPTELGAGPFRIRDAFALGVLPGRLRNPELARPFPGVRTADRVDTVTTLASAYAAKMTPDAFFSHVTAARLWGIPLPSRLQQGDTLHVAVPTHGVIPVGKGVRGHRLQLQPDDVAINDGLRLSTLARTWCDLAASLSEEELIAAGDFLIWRRRPAGLKLNSDDLARALDRFRGRRGRPVLRVVLPFLTERADSPPESAFRVRFAQAGMPKPQVNEKLFDPAGNFLAMPDLSFAAYRVCFDYEGDHHRTDPGQWEKDIARVPRLEDAGWSHLRASKADYRNSCELIERLKRRLRRAGWTG
ncbi:MAG: endonuclease domain-containing protein [Microbacteriaceae bacterium]